MEIKTANQLYKESGKPKPFKEWLAERVLSADGSTDGGIVVNRPLNDSIQQAIYQMRKQGGLTDTASGKYVLGIHQNYLFAAGALTAGFIGYKLYQKFKS